MSKKIYEESNILAIANAIRQKNGSQTQYTTAQMPNAILDIYTEPDLETLSVNQNGEYTPSQNKDGFSSVTVNVQATPILQEKTATQNGNVLPDNGYDGLSKVVVNVSGGETVYSGITIPNDSLGSDGDIYEMTVPKRALSSPNADCYINTNFKPYPETYCDVCFLFLNDPVSSRYDTVFGTRDGSWSRYTLRYDEATNGGLELQISDYKGHTFDTYSTGIRKNNAGWHTVSKRFYRVVDDVSGAMIKIDNGSSRFPYYLFLFANNNKGTPGDYASIKMEYFRLLDENYQPTMWLIPDLDNGVACMKDLVTGQFFYNSGAGSFVYEDLNENRIVRFIKENSKWRLYIKNLNI